MSQQKVAEAASHLLFSETLKSKQVTRKCLGVAKNYFTQAMKKDSSSVQVPHYPYIFSKSLSSLCPRGQSFKLPKHAAPNTINHEVELGVMLGCGNDTNKNLG